MKKGTLYTVVVAALGLLIFQQSLSAGLFGPETKNASFIGLPTPYSGGHEELPSHHDERADTALTLTDRSAPEEFFLGQNRPNPFRSSTAISYGLPYPTWVRISILSLFGSHVRTIIDEPQRAGIYSVDFSAYDLAPGTYFYRIETDYGARTMRLTRAR